MADKSPPTPPIVMTPPAEEEIQNESLDLNHVEVIDDLNINRWLMRIMRLGASYGSNGYRTGSVSSSSSGSRSRRLSIADTSASNLLRPPNTSRGRRFSDSMNFVSNESWSKFQLAQKSNMRKGLQNISHQILEGVLARNFLVVLTLKNLFILQDLWSKVISSK